MICKKSYVRTLNVNRFFNSSIYGYRYTSISLPGDLRPKTSNDMKKFDSFMHFHDGKLNKINTTEHILYGVLIWPNGFNPFETNSKRTFRGSKEKLGNSKSNCFHPSASIGCLNTFSVSTRLFLCRLSLCHCMSAKLSCNTNNCCNLGKVTQYFL